MNNQHHSISPSSNNK